MKNPIAVAIAMGVLGPLLSVPVAFAGVDRVASTAKPELLASDTIAATELAKTLAGPVSQRPLLLHVGFGFLYHGGHIPGSRYVGAASTVEGLVELRKALIGVQKDREIVVYCGCCPFKDCPNIGPAVAELHRLGFRKVRALYLPEDFYSSWANKGHPVARDN